MGLPSAQQCKTRIAKVAATLPACTLRPGGDGRHVGYMIGKKTFAYFTDDHHGDGRLAFQCKAPAGEQEALLGCDPERYFRPPYTGPRGWIGVWLDVRSPDWQEIAELMTEAYRLTAPKRLAALLD